MLVFQLETELFGVEVNRAAHILDLIPDAMKVQDKAVPFVCGRAGVVRRSGRFFSHLTYRTSYSNSRRTIGRRNRSHGILGASHFLAGLAPRLRLLNRLAAFLHARLERGGFDDAIAQFRKSNRRSDCQTSLSLRC